MGKVIIFILSILSFLNLSAQNKIIGFKPEIEPYINFIKEQQISPITYLLEKYKTYDVIVFGERDHRDITQYYFLEKLINSEDFYKQVNIIYTEVGSSNYNDTLNKILQNDFLSEAEVDQKLIEIYREISYQAFWDKNNFLYLWKTIYKFNLSHPNYPITIKMTSHPFNWHEILDTTICRVKTQEVEVNYDKSMAEYFLESFDENQNNKRNKAFVIMNYPHSLRKWTSDKEVTYSDMFGAYVEKVLEGRVCYVIVNPYRINSLQPVANGKWDAAFKYCDYKNIGFDFNSSPFGKDTFDVWSANGILSFENLYDGIIYVSPTSQCKNIIGIPGFIDRKFGKEYLRRIKLRMYIYTGKEYKTKIKWERESCNTVRVRTVQDDNEFMYGEDKSKYFDSIVNKWLIFEQKPANNNGNGQ